MRLPRPRLGLVRTHEALFVDCYRLLLRRALRLTAGDRTRAEDLLHDAYVQFTLIRPAISNLASVEAYLIGILKNLHASELRRTYRRRVIPEPIDELMLLDVRPSALTSAASRQALLQICQYACGRKASSKAASLFILRFFLGFFPSDIARLARMRAGAVDQALRLARQEARAWHDDPGKWAFLPPPDGPALTDLPFTLDESPQAFLARLRARILSSATDPCVEPDDLARMYGERVDASPAIETKVLAHLVACERCLARACEAVSIDPPDDRSPDETLGQDPSGRRSTDASEFRRAAERKRRTTFECRPEVLRVLVNGQAFASFTTGGHHAWHTVPVNLPEPVSFIEVFAADEIRLALLPVRRFPGGPLQQRVRVRLSEHRVLEVRVSFADLLPELTLVYDGDGLEPFEERPITPDPDDEPTSSRAGWRWLRWLRHLISARRGRLRPRFLFAVAVLLLVLWASVGNPARALAAVWDLARDAVTTLRELFDRPELPAVPPAPSLPAAPTPTPPAPELTPASPTAVRAPVDLFALEIEALDTLDRAQALIGREVLVSRLSRHVSVQLMVPKAAARAELRQALDALEALAGVTVDVPQGSRDEHPRPNQTARTRIVSVERARFPAQDVLEAALAARGVAAGDVAERARRTADDALVSARQVFLHAGVIQDLITRIDAAERRQLAEPALRRWRAVLDRHIQAALRELSVVRAATTIMASEEADTASVVPDSSAASADPEHDRAARLFVLAQALDEAVGEAFASAEVAPERLRLRESRFTADLIELERLLTQLAAS